MMVWNPKFFLPSFVKIGPPVVERKIFSIFSMFEHSRDVEHVTWISRSNFVPPTHGGSTNNFTFIGQVVSKNAFEKCVWTTNGPSLRDDFVPN